MARFGESFLQQLGRPGWTQGMFGLGQAIGGAQGQIRDQRKQQAFNQLMQQAQGAMGAGDFASMKILSQQLSAAGYPEQAGKLMQSAVTLEQQQKTKQEATGKTRTSAQLLMTELQDYMNSPDVPASVQREAGNLLRAAAQAGDRAILLEPRVEMLRQRLGKDKKEGKITKGNEVILRDPQGNYYTSVVMYDEQTGTPTRRLIPQPGSPAKPVGKLSVVSGTTGAGAFDQPEIKGKTKLETDYSTLRVDAVAQLPRLKNTAENLQAALDLLESGEVQTGGFPRRIARGLTDFMGTTPKNIGEFETRLGNEVLARLEAFTGAISNEERKYLEKLVGDYFASGESNIGRLRTILRETNRIIQNSILIGSSPNFESYRTAVMTPMKQIADSSLDFIPEEEREDARQFLLDGKTTLEELQDIYND